MWVQIMKHNTPRIFYIIDIFTEGSVYGFPGHFDTVKSTIAVICQCDIWCGGQTSYSP